MANNYLLFSEVLTLKNKKEEKWAREELTRLSEAEDGNGCPVIDFQWNIEDGGIWFYTEEAGEPNTVGTFVQSFLKKFYPEDVWKLTWAATCSKPRIGEFSGGAMVVTAKKIYFMEASDWAYRKTKELDRIKELMKTKKSKAKR